jgi:hypothetical protein
VKKPPILSNVQNAFLKCGHPRKLQELADSLTAHDLLRCGQKWLAYLTPFFKESERKQAGCQHRLFFSQVEYCDNLIFYRRAALDQLGERLLDANRTIGQPNKISVIFGRKITKTVQRQTANGDRGYRSAQSGDPQPLWPWLYQTVRT